MLPENVQSYDDLIKRFNWALPDYFNIGHACSNAVARRTPDKTAIFDFSGSAPISINFAQLAEQSTRFAAALNGIGIARGDRVAVMLPQSIEAVIAHLGIYKCGGVAVPLAMQFGPQSLEHRLAASSAKAMIADHIGLSRLDTIGDKLPDLKIKIVHKGLHPNAHQFDELRNKGSADFKTVQTRLNDPAMMLFTSGTTGQPKGALHAHRVLLGHLPGIQMAQGFMPHNNDRFWTPSDWAWAGGLLNALLPALYCGVPVVAARAPKFEPDWAIDLIGKAEIRNIFMPPTALKLMQAALEKKPSFDLRTLACAGEALGAQTLNWAQDRLGIKINEFYGQTECNAIISACHQVGIFKQGSMGKAVPGHRVETIDVHGKPCAHGQIGEVAIYKDSPVMFLEYFDDASATAQKFQGDWMLTGDKAVKDDEGYFHFLGRNDDIITSAGYRIGPTEIEDCLTAHPAIELAAVTGQPDLIRTEIVTAHIKLVPGYNPSIELKNEISAYVKTRLSAHEYPRQILFVDEIPLTESGKVIRRLFRGRT